MEQLIKRFVFFLLKLMFPLFLFCVILFMMISLIVNIFQTQQYTLEQIAYATCETQSTNSNSSTQHVPNAKILPLKQLFDGLGHWDGSVRFPVNNGSVSADFNSFDEVHVSERHTGVDLASTGDAIALVDGVVVAVGNGSARGHYIAIAFKDKSGRALTYLYQHLAKSAYKNTGDFVRAGEKIGPIGSTGWSTGVHLHIEVEIADMSQGYPKWVGTYPINTNVLFDPITFFGLPRTFSAANSGGNNGGIQNQNSNCSSNASLVGKDNAEKLYNFFVSKGYSPEATAAILGNFAAESGVDPTRKQDGGGPGRGLAQWGEGADGGRFNKLITFCAENKKGDPYSLECQAEFVIYELNTTYKHVAELLRISGTVETYTKDFQNVYEAPADRVGSLQKRIDAAKSYLAAFKK